MSASEMSAQLVDQKDMKIKADEKFVSLMKEMQERIGYELPQQARDMMRICFNEGFCFASENITPIAVKALDMAEKAEAALRLLGKGI